MLRAIGSALSWLALPAVFAVHTWVSSNAAAQPSPSRALARATAPRNLSNSGAPSEIAPFEEAEARTQDAVPPPPTVVNYLQYGVAFTAEFVANAGPICADESLACILGSGGGIATRVGIRRSGPWYVGGAYELSKQDASKLYRLPILQQLRFEVRHHFYTARVTQPFVTAHAGLAGYGNEWAIATWGGSAFLGAGFESQIPNGPLLGLTIGYRAIYLRAFEDSSGLFHNAGVAHLIGIDATLEARERL